MCLSWHSGVVPMSPVVRDELAERGAMHVLHDDGVWHEMPGAGASLHCATVRIAAEPLCHGRQGLDMVEALVQISDTIIIKIVFLSGALFGL